MGNAGCSYIIGKTQDIWQEAVRKVKETLHSLMEKIQALKATDVFRVLSGDSFGSSQCPTQASRMVSKFTKARQLRALLLTFNVIGGLPNIASVLMFECFSVRLRVPNLMRLGDSHLSNSPTELHALSLTG